MNRMHTYTYLNNTWYCFACVCTLKRQCAKNLILFLFSFIQCYAFAFHPVLVCKSKYDNRQLTYYQICPVPVMGSWPTQILCYKEYSQSCPLTDLCQAGSGAYTRSRLLRQGYDPFSSSSGGFPFPCIPFST